MYDRGELCELRDAQYLAFVTYLHCMLCCCRKAKKKAEAEAEKGRLSLQDLQGGCLGLQPDLASHQLDESQFLLDTGSPAAGDRRAFGSIAAELPDTPFAAPAAQVYKGFFCMSCQNGIALRYALLWRESCQLSIVYKDDTMSFGCPGSS